MAVALAVIVYELLSGVSFPRPLFPEYFQPGPMLGIGALAGVVYFILAVRPRKCFVTDRRIYMILGSGPGFLFRRIAEAPLSFVVRGWVEQDFLEECWNSGDVILETAVPVERKGGTLMTDVPDPAAIGSPERASYGQNRLIIRNVKRPKEFLKEIQAACPRKSAWPDEDKEPGKSGGSGILGGFGIIDPGDFDIDPLDPT